MAYAIVHHFPGGTKDQYEKSLAAVHPSKSNLRSRPNLPCRWAFGGRLDDDGRARLQGELGAISGPDPHAENEARHRGGIGWAPQEIAFEAQPAKISAAEPPRADQATSQSDGRRVPASSRSRGRRRSLAESDHSFPTSWRSPNPGDIIVLPTTLSQQQPRRPGLRESVFHDRGRRRCRSCPERRELGIPGPSAACRLQAPQPRKRGRWGARCRAAPFGRGRREQGSFWRSGTKRARLARAVGPFSASAGCPVRS